MIFSIDHIVFAADAAESTDLRDSLAETGFQREEFTLEFPEIGATSESLSFASGGFVEFVVGSDRRLAPEVWFADTPRVIGLGFSSNDFAADTWWSSGPRGWVMNEDHVLPDGSCLTIHAAGPHEHSSDFYIFVMDRPDGRLQFSERTEGPRLSRLKFVGLDADVWDKRLREWLQLPERRALEGLIGSIGDLAQRRADDADGMNHVRLVVHRVPSLACNAAGPDCFVRTRSGRRIRSSDRRCCRRGEPIRESELLAGVRSVVPVSPQRGPPRPTRRQWSRSYQVCSRPLESGLDYRAPIT